MPYHRCAECGLTVRGARRFTARSCASCSVPLDRTEFDVAALLTTELIPKGIEPAGTGPGSEVRFEATPIEGCRRQCGPRPVLTARHH
jgi:hypothetical protein